MTYPTYQAAKIANPECEIVRWNKNEEHKAVSKSELSGYLTTWCHCDPADCCMTVKQFLDAGHKFVDGDKFLHTCVSPEEDVTVGISNVSEECANKPSASVDDGCYILKAKALEETKTYRYEKVGGFSFALEADFNVGILFRPNELAGEGYLKCETEDDVAYAAANEMLYRRIEVTDRELFIEDMKEKYPDVCIGVF